MTLNCKVGDLAIVLRDPFPENIGRVVSVGGPAVFVTDAPAWRCEVKGAPVRIIEIERPWESYFGNEAEIYDADLMPISGVPVDEDVTEDLREPA
jgi:serine acetyltransferase